MNRPPLYESTTTEWPTRFPVDGHAGLWFDRFFDKYDGSWQVPKDDSGKLAWIQTVTKTVVGGTAVAAYAFRQRNLVTALGGQFIIVKTDWHFATGLGNNHPVENGFAWHPTLGAPYLTGAAVKGLLRAWCEQWAAGFDAEKRRQWFGPSLDELNPKTEEGIKKQDAAAGELIFFDALPTGPVQLKADVMTPHYGKWYEAGDEPPQNDGSNVPADWHSPVPVPFLVVASGQIFQFAVATRPGSGISVDDVVKELESALAALGAGAKTAAGYGRMEVDEKTTRHLHDKAAQLAKQQADASKTPNQLSIDRLRKTFANLRQYNLRETVGGALYQQMQELLTSADTNASGSWTAPEKRELADLIAAEHPHTLRLDSKEKAVKQILVRLRGAGQV